MQKLNKNQLEEVAMVFKRVWLHRKMFVFEKKVAMAQNSNKDS